ncbi:MAG: ABC transporter ATP-binding protein [Clostridia bacterium]|nr:ABC transporter ATP-binding protein [Clostridia bacterium]
MIHFKNVSKAYGDHQVLKDIDVSINKGEITVILGPSGCGKSTLLKLINKTILPDEGDIYLNKQNIRDIQDTTLKRSIGYAIQGVGLFPHMSVKENISTVPKLLKWDKRTIDNRVQALMEMMELPETFSKKYPIHLSGGEAQRVGVARALAGNPEILLMDEPFGALDPITRGKLQRKLLNIQKKLHKTIVFVTHDVSEALLLADELILMKDQSILKKDHPYKIVTEAKALLKTFTGGSFAFELLEKFRISDIVDQLTGLQDFDGYCLHEDISLKEVVSEMILQGKSQLTVRNNHQYYRLDFYSLMDLAKRKHYE